MAEGEDRARAGVGRLTVRDATAADLPAIVAIYNEIVASSTAIWRDEPVTVADRRAWLEAQRVDRFPVLVAVVGDEQAPGAAGDGRLVGFASLGAFRPWPGYHPTVEHSIHVGAAHRGRGVGSALLDALVERARALGKSVLVAGVDAANLGSLRFHGRAGFREVARMPGVGRKFARPVDLVLLQRDLTAADPAVGDRAAPGPDGPDPDAGGRSHPGAAGADRTTTITRIDHVQLAMPAGREADAVAFYARLLGIPQVPKPPHLAARGGCWFEAGALKVHLGVEADFRPARKAHPALLVDGLAGLLAVLADNGVAVVDDEPLEGYARAYVEDPFGNRIELLEPR